MGMLLAVYANRRGSGFGDAALELIEVERLVRQIVRVGQDDAVALGHVAFAIAYVLKDLPFAEDQIKRALALNPNLASAWMFSAWLNVWSANPARALKDLAHATRLDPLNDSGMLKVPLANAYFFLDRPEEALRIAENLLLQNPDSHVALRLGIISAAFAGKMDRAKTLATHLKKIDPAFRVSRLDDYLGPYRSAEYREKYKEGLRKAGLPE